MAAAVGLATATAVPSAAKAAGGAYAQTRHGDARTGVQRLPETPPGACAQCHLQHVPRDGSAPDLGRARLFAPNDNALCATCHPGEGRAGSFPGAERYARSVHALSPATVWPGPRPRARAAGEAGLCVNCHDPHGVKDAAGVVPALLAAREDVLCVRCHDGSRARRDVRAELSKPYAHPIASARLHRPQEGADPGDFSALPRDARHAACSDCHNAHLLEETPRTAVAPEAPGALAGVARVRVTNGAAGTQPVYTPVAANDASPAREYEVCFKCHSSWTRQPLRQPDLATLLNPANPSYHPVEAPGRNPRIDARAFAGDWRAGSMVYCSDCHGSDDPEVRGPHGSNHRYLLRRPYAASSLPQRSSAGDLCFDCHRHEVYASVASPELAASRFNPPAAPWGHAFHVGVKGYSCWACHESHGTPQHPALLATGRSPGMTSFFSTPAGGTCGTTCHAARSYGLNYPR